MAPDAYIGQQGLTRYLFNDTEGVYFWEDWREHVGTDLTGKDIWPMLDFAHDTGLYRVINCLQTWEGFFRAPASGQYRFLMSCDDSCSYKMSIDDPLNMQSAETLLSRGDWTTYRNFDATERDETSPDFGVVFSK